MKWIEMKMAMWEYTLYVWVMVAAVCVCVRVCPCRKHTTTTIGNTVCVFGQKRWEIFFLPHTSPRPSLRVFVAGQDPGKTLEIGWHPGRLTPLNRPGIGIRNPAPFPGVPR